MTFGQSCGIIGISKVGDIIKCCNCNKGILRGQRYKSPTLTSLYFCSEECYQKYLNKNIEKKQSKKKTTNDTTTSSSLKFLKDYINKLWQEQVNWPFMMKQIKNVCVDYNLSHKDLYLVLKYAVEYEDYVVDIDYGLLQFEKYIVPAMEFKTQVLQSKQQAMDMPDEEVLYVKPVKQKVRRVRKDDDW